MSLANLSFVVPAGVGRIGDVAADRSRKPETTRTRKKRLAGRTDASFRLGLRPNPMMDSPQSVPVANRF
jgi:hypothetical protein